MDQCKHCVVRGEIEKCQNTECGQHDSWYAQDRQQQINELTAMVEMLRDNIINPDSTDEENLEVLKLTQPQALNAIRVEVVEECAKLANRKLRGITAECNGYNKASTEIVQAIEGLARKYKEE